MKFQFSKKYNNSTLGGVLIHALVAMFIIAALCLSYFYIYLPETTNHAESITVPNVEGMQVEQVAAFLKDHDLRYEINDSSYSADHPPLAVLKQVPAAGAKVKENRKIYLSVNRINPPTVPMPDLIDGSLTNADAVLKGSELVRGKIHLVRGPFLNVVTEMRVNGNEVVPGVRIPKGTVVDLVVMDGGSNTLKVPNLLGMTYEDAKIPLLGSNLSIGKVQLIGDTTDGGVILKQHPLPTVSIKVGEVVDLWIGKPGALDVAPDDELEDDEEQL